MNIRKAGGFALIVLIMTMLIGARFTGENARPGKKEVWPGAAALDWQEPVIIANEPLHVYNEKNIVRFHPSGMLYICFKDNIDDQKTNKRSIKLYKYDGVKSTMVKNVSEDSLMAYEPDMVIGEDGWIHISWAEAVNANANTQYIKYRYFDGTDWSPVITLRTLFIDGTTGGWNPEKLDDVRLAVDKEHNVFVGYMKWPMARCAVLSRYGEKVYDDPFPMEGRSKHASVAADSEYVHLTWQQQEGGEYTVRYARRKNAPKARWTLCQPVVASGGHRPFIRLDKNEVPHLVYMKDASGSTKRDLHYRVWKGSAFSGSYMVSDTNADLYHTPAIAPLDANNVLIHSQTWSGGAINYYNMMRNGKWGGLGVINRIKAWSSFGECDLNSSGIAAVSYAAGGSIELVTSGKLVINSLPVAKIRTDKDSFFWGDTIKFDGSESRDADGTIVRYVWRIVNDKETLEGVNGEYTFLKNWGNVRIRLTVTDNKGGQGSAEKTVQVNALYSALDVVAAPKRITTLVYDRDGYVVTWKENPKNAQINYNIVSYRIFSKPAGSGNGAYVLKGSVAADKSAFADVDVAPGASCTYAVAAVDDNGHQSPYVNTGN
jgi:hypothetical protein